MSFLLQELVLLLGVLKLLSKFVDVLSLHLDLLFSHLLHLDIVHLRVTVPILAVLKHLALVSAHLGLLSLALLLGLELLHLDSKVGDHLDQLDVLSHDVHVVLLVDLLLLVKSLLQRVLGVVQVSLLVLVLLLDIWIDFNVLHLLVLNEEVEVLIDNPLQLIKVIDVLSYPIDGILEALDLDLVPSNLGSVLLDQLLHVLLSSSQVIHDVTQVSVDLVELSQVLVHVIRFFFQTSDFHATGSDVSLKFFDLVVQHELELLELLGFLFEGVDLLFFVTDHVVSLDNLDTFGSNLVLELLFFDVLEIELKLLVQSLTSQLINLCSKINQLSVGELKLSFGLKRHLIDLLYILSIL